MTVKKKKATPKNQTRAKKTSSPQAQSVGAKSTTPDYTQVEVIQTALEAAVNNLLDLVRTIGLAQPNKEKRDKCAVLFAVGTPFGELMGHNGNNRMLLGIQAMSNMSINQAASKSFDFEDKEITEGTSKLPKFLLEALRKGAAIEISPDFTAVSPNHPKAN